MPDSVKLTNFEPLLLCPLLTPCFENSGLSDLDGQLLALPNLLYKICNCL